MMVMVYGEAWLRCLDFELLFPMRQLDSEAINQSFVG
jgi:hypothetical protein